MPASHEAASGGPLDGIRVLDLSSVVMGPLATQILGDLGADVITVETRDGDINRIMGSGPCPGLSGVSLNLLRNKRNISLNIAHPDGRAALLRVAADCDVFVTNLRAGSVGRLRLGYPDIAVIRPDVIYCQAHGFPSDSPQAGSYKVIPPPARFSATPGFGATAGPAGRAAYPRGAGRGRPDRRADYPAGRGRRA
jgi:crotonobetainyl-CoA:carnitine CoA-transferase CaiB-like acyl-CoA transferase